MGYPPLTWYYVKGHDRKTANVSNTPTAVQHEDGDTWEENGFTFTQVFGLPKITGAPVEYQEVVSDEGAEIKWEDEPVFMGTYLGHKVIPDVESVNGKRDVTLLLFADQNGVKRSAWGGYILDNFAKTTPEKTPVTIQYTGKKDFGKSGQTMQAFDIWAQLPGKPTANQQAQEPATVG